MEKDPSNNPENINQKPATDEEQSLSFSEHMEQKQKYEQAFKEAQDNGSLPEGVRDAQDYQEYLEENQAREAEQSKAEQEAENDFNKRVEQAVNVIDKIKNPDDKDLAISMLGWLSNKIGKESGVASFAFDKIVKYNQVNEGESFLDFLNKEKENDGFGERYDSFNHSDAYNEKEKFWESTNRLTWGNYLQQEIVPVEDNPANERFVIANADEIDGYYYPFESVYANMDQTEKLERATYRLLAKTKIPGGVKRANEEILESKKRKIELEEGELTKEGRRELRIMEEVCKRYDHHIEDYAFRVIEDTMRGYGLYHHNTDEFMNNEVKSCAKIRRELKSLNRCYKLYSKNLADGQAILDNFKNSQQ